MPIGFPVQIELPPAVMTAIPIAIILALIPLLIWAVWQADGWLAARRRRRKISYRAPPS
jgi:hypothetical protein